MFSFPFLKKQTIDVLDLLCIIVVCQNVLLLFWWRSWFLVSCWWSFHRAMVRSLGESLAYCRGMLDWGHWRDPWTVFDRRQQMEFLKITNPFGIVKNDHIKSYLRNLTENCDCIVQSEVNLMSCWRLRWLDWSSWWTGCLSALQTLQIWHECCVIAIFGGLVRDNSLSGPVHSFSACFKLWTESQIVTLRSVEENFENFINPFPIKIIKKIMTRPPCLIDVRWLQT